MEIRSDWESLAPEILAMVLQRVQAGSGERGEGRRIVAVAGVCRSWRHSVLLLQQEAAAAAAQAAVLMEQSATTGPSTTSNSSPSTPPELICFPAAIRRQVPAADCPLQCVLKKKGNSFSFFQSFPSVEGGANQEYFLLGARKRYMPSCSSFELTTDTRILQQQQQAAKLEFYHRAASTSSHPVSLASVKSNFSRSEFTITGSSDIHEVEAPDQSASLAAAALYVKYSEDITAGMRQRKLSCSLQQAATVPESRRTSSKASASPKVSRAASRAPVLRAAGASATARSSFFARWSCSALFKTGSRQARRVHTSSLEEEQEQEQRQGVLQQKRVVVEDHEAAEVEAPAAAGARTGAVETAGSSGGGSRLSLKSKMAEWNQERGCWSLDFKGRATVPSIHNFQLTTTSVSSSDYDNHILLHESNRVVLQLGKVGKGIYHVDFCEPLSALQAFSICLTSFATNVGLEP